MRILVGAPTYNGQLTTQYARSLLELWGEIGAQAEWRTTKATLIAWAWNVFASQVLQCFEALTDENGIAMSEDVSFCRRWRAIGGELWATFDQAVGYTGPFTFRATG